MVGAWWGCGHVKSLLAEIDEADRLHKCLVHGVLHYGNNHSLDFHTKRTHKQTS